MNTVVWIGQIHMCLDRSKLVFGLVKMWIEEYMYLSI